jgi:hypothetical protein
MEHAAHPFVELISGKTLRRLLTQEHWFSDELNDPVNVCFAELDGERCVRFFFDAVVFFWNLVESPDLPESNGENRYLLKDTGVRGTVSHATLRESFTAALLELHLTNGRVVQLHNSEDRSWIEQVGN